MKKTLMSAVMVASLCAFGAAATAQEKPMPGDKPMAGGQKEHSMSGCVQKGAMADTYVVANAAEKGPKMIGVVESKANLAPHVGHHIEVTGTAVSNAEAEAMKPAPPKADHYMRLSAVKMISATCPAK